MWDLIESRWFQIHECVWVCICTVIDPEVVYRLKIKHFLYYTQIHTHNKVPHTILRCQRFIRLCVCLANSQVPDKNVRFTDQRHTLFISLPVSKEMWKNQIREKIRRRQKNQNKEQRNQLKRIICESTKQRNAWMRVWMEKKKNTKIFERLTTTTDTQ